MKKIIIPFLFLTIIGCGSSILTQIENIKEAEDITYGYTIDNPIRIGYSNTQESITYSKMYLYSLRDSSNNPLNLIERFSVGDPNYNPSFFEKLPKRFDHSISDGMLNCYILTKNNDRDTIQLYFDIYDDKPLFIPKGLKFVKE